MKHQQPKAAGPTRPSLDERLAANPALAAAVHALIDEMDESLAQGSSADAVEERVQAGVRTLGHQALTHWAQHAHDLASEKAPRQKPGAVKHVKKNSAGKQSLARSKSTNRSGD